MKRVILALLLAAGSLMAEEPKQTTPEQQIAVLKATIAAMQEQLSKTQVLLDYFQKQPTPAGANLAAIRAEVEKACGCKIDELGEPLPLPQEKAK